MAMVPGEGPLGQEGDATDPPIILGLVEVDIFIIWELSIIGPEPNWPGPGPIGPGPIDPGPEPMCT